MEPIGYWTKYPAKDPSLFQELENKYGSQLQNTSKREKLFLVWGISSHLCCTAPNDFRNEINDLPDEICCRLSTAEQEILIQALITQLRLGAN